MIFADGILLGQTYRPVGLNAVWSLAGVVAAFEQPFCFNLRDGMDSSSGGFVVGFRKGLFCFVGGFRGEAIDVYTRTTVKLHRAKKVTFQQRVWETFCWVPDSAMMPFKDLVRVGNSVLLSDDSHVCTQVGQRYSDWENNQYLAEEDCHDNEP